MKDELASMRRYQTLEDKIESAKKDVSNVYLGLHCVSFVRNVDCSFSNFSLSELILLENP